MMVVQTKEHTHVILADVLCNTLQFNIEPLFNKGALCMFMLANGTITIDLSQISAFLNYGFFGLSVIMMILGYGLFKTIISQDKPNSTKIKAAKFFLLMAFVFMVSSGVLELYRTKQNTKIFLNVVPWSERHAKKYGPLRVQQGLQSFEFQKSTIQLNVKNEEAIHVEFYELSHKLDELLKEVAVTQTQLNDALIREGENDEELGFDDNI